MTTMTITTNTKTMSQAQLYWDEQDPTNTGWWLRYYDARGNESGCAVEADQDATTEELAAAVTAAACSETGRIKILRSPSEQFRGWIDLEDGTATGWSAL